MKCVILTNAWNEKLWPLSKESFPNLLFNLKDGKNIFQHVFETALALTSAKNILTITPARLINEINIQLKDVSKKGLIITEPLSKGTAAATAAALTYLQTQKDEMVLIIPASFIFKDISQFKTAVEKAKIPVKKGYIARLLPASLTEKSPYINSFKNLECYKKVNENFEKFNKKNFCLNSGIYLAKISILLDILLNQQYSGFSKKMFHNNDIKYELYENISECSIDNILSEHVDKIVEFESNCYNYLCWQTIYNESEKDTKKNTISGNVILDNVKNSLISSSKELTAVSGIQNTIIVETEDTVLVCDNSRTGDIPELIKKLKENVNLPPLADKIQECPYGFYTNHRSINGWLSKTITIYPEQKISLNINKKSGFSHIVILDGSAVITINGEKHILKKRQSINIPLKVNHSIKNNSKDILKIFEVQKGY